jgi:hypothetical protein
VLLLPVLLLSVLLATFDLLAVRVNSIFFTALTRRWPSSHLLQIEFNAQPGIGFSRADSDWNWIPAQN